MTESRPVDFSQALDCIRTMIERHVAKHGKAPPFFVAVGGTAMAAWDIRRTSFDVDLFSTFIDEDIVHDVETELKQVYGPDFKIDATPGENLWGPIIFRDLADAEEITVIEAAGVRVPVKALSSEDLVLAKLAAERKKDRDDLVLLALRVDEWSLLERFNTVIGWYGDRGTVTAFADRFIDFMTDHKGLPAAEIIENLSVPDYVKRQLREARTDDDTDEVGPGGPKKLG